MGTPLYGYGPDNIVAPADAAAKTGVPAVNIVKATEAPEGLILVTTAAHAPVDPNGDALPVALFRGV